MANASIIVDLIENRRQLTRVLRLLDGDIIRVCLTINLVGKTRLTVLRFTAIYFQNS